MDAFKTVLPIIPQIIQQTPITGLVLAVLAGLLLGLLLRGKGGSSWLGNLVLFPVRLFTDLLDIIHTKKFKYYGLILALLAIEAFFAFRAATVYYDVLHEHILFTEMMIVCVIVFVAIFLCGYMVVTHEGTWDWRRWLTAVVVIIHDCVGTLWMNYILPGSSTLAPVGHDPFAITLKASLTAGMCAVTVIPFIMGFWAGELRPQMVQEQEQEVSEFTSAAIAKIKRRAVDRVLRMANHTDVVRLVQALPADEFTDFKGFVMPIIAPGVPHNLTSQQAAPSEKDANTPTNVDAKNATEVPNADHQSGDKSDAKTEGQQSAAASPVTQQDGDKADDKKSSQQATHPAGTAATKTADKPRQPKGRQPAAKQASPTAARDEKIRQYAAKNPGTNNVKLAAKFQVSERTIQRALATASEQQHGDNSDAQTGDNLVADGNPKTGGKNATEMTPSEQQHVGENDESLASKNGHSNHEPNTGEMETISVEQLNVAQQN